MSFVDEAQSLAGELVRLRRDLHREPEVGLDLPRTQEKVLRALQPLPLELTVGDKTTSVTAVLRGGAPNGPRPTPAVLLRADMDALPLQERTQLSYASQRDGAMHACGHDLHTAMLVGGAHLLSEQRHRLAGDVVFMFQPGEEGWDGASVMIDEGVLEASGRRADAAYGMHVFSGLIPGGEFVTKPGTMLAASDALTVTVLGAGGHGSAPHLAIDPVAVVAEMVTALQTMATRQFDAFDPIVLTVGVLSAGSRRNIIPETATFEATLRSFSGRSRERLVTAVPRLLHGIADAHGAQVDVRYEDEYPVTVNNPDETDFAAATITELFGEKQHTPLAQPLSGSEDFSRVLARVPGSFVGLGATPTGADPHAVPFNHSPYAAFDDGVLASGAALFAQLAARRLDLLIR